MFAMDTAKIIVPESQQGVPEEQEREMTFSISDLN